LKAEDHQRLDELAKYDETKSLAYFYKLLEEICNQKGDHLHDNNNEFDEIYNSTALLTFLKFYMKNGNSDLVFINCILTLEPFS